MEFKVGDIVEWCGARGTVFYEDINAQKPICVKFENSDYLYYFSENGKYFEWHKEPSLKLIERPKQKVKKYKILFKTASGEWEMSSSYYETVKDFDYNNIYEDKHILPQTQIEVEE